MDGPNTLKGWNELLDYLQTNNAFRKSKFSEGIDWIL